MELTAALFDEITGLSELPPASDEAENDRRQHFRMPIGTRASIVPIVKGVEQTGYGAVIRDMSVAGVGILSAQPMRHGDQFSVLFPGKTKTIKVKCLTQRSEPGGVGGTQFIVGATFLELMSVVEAVAKKMEPAEAAPAMTSKPARPSGIFAMSSKPLDAQIPSRMSEPTDAAPALAVERAPIALEKSESTSNAPLIESTAQTQSPVVVSPEEFPDLASMQMGFEIQPEFLSEDDLMSALADPAPVGEKLEVNAMPVTNAPVQAVSVNEPAIASEAPAEFLAPAAQAPAPAKGIELQGTPVPAESEQTTVWDSVGGAKPTVAAITIDKAGQSPKEHSIESRPVVATTQPPQQATMKIAGESAPTISAKPANVAQAGKNQEVLAKVKARLLNQNQVLQHNAGELGKTQKQLEDQKALTDEARQQSAQLKAQYTAIEQRWAQEREKLIQQLKAASAESVLFKQQVQTLQLKSVSDDQAIAELSALLTGESVAAPTTGGAPESAAA